MEESSDSESPLSLEDRVLDVLSEGEKMHCLQIRKAISNPMPPKRDVNRILYRLHLSGQLGREQDDPNEKPLWWVLK